ncbi:MAG TPA: 6-carboxytetrahydropterin synthase QueD, partial [Ktedonobacterales bacterium]|nr:6-carboxytetrahydropterin synthase QueD [Ktedonobacterales bacterium]
MYQVCKSFSFDAAHILRGYDGNCARLHGHRWEVAVCVEGPDLDGIGMLVDFRFIKEAAQRATANYDHNMLNELSPYDEINPSAENIARTIYTAIRTELATSAPYA